MGAVLIFADGLMTAKVGDKIVSVSKFKLASTGRRKVIDLEGIQGDTAGLKFLGIYELKGAELRLNLGLDERPTEFQGQTKAVAGQMLMKLQRVK